MRSFTKPQKNCTSFPIYTDRNRGNVCGDEYSLWDQGKRNVKLGQAKFTDLGPLS